MVKEEVEIKKLWEIVSDICKKAENIIINKKHFWKREVVFDLLEKAKKLINSITLLSDILPAELSTETRRLKSDLLMMIENTEKRIKSSVGDLEKHQKDLFHNIIRFRTFNHAAKIQDVIDACRNAENISDTYAEIKSKLIRLREACSRLIDDYKSISSLFQAGDLGQFIRLFTFYRKRFIENFHNHLKELRNCLEEIDISQIEGIRGTRRFTAEQRSAIVRSIRDLKDIKDYLRILDESLEAFKRTVA